MRLESLPKDMGLSYQIFVIGNDGPDQPTPGASAAGNEGSAGRDASCNWASQCTTTCTDGGVGGTGVQGKNGSPQSGEKPIDGHDAQPANITISDLIGSDLYLFSAGGNGGTAGGGGQGGTGGTGGRGGNGAGCPAGPGCGACKGATGGTGGPGGNGGISGNGGNGTTVTVKYHSSKGNSVYYTAPASAGGRLPLKGNGGIGGAGGYPSGNAGGGGDNGKDGSSGNNGNPSTVNIIPN